MTIEHDQIKVRGRLVDIVRKDIKHLHLAVYPPEGRLRVAAPARLDDETIRLAVIKRLPWIRRREARFQEQERQSAREMVTGESHYVWGRRYRLDVCERDEKPQVHITGPDRLRLQVRPGSSREKRQDILLDWYRSQLRTRMPGLVKAWAPIVGVDVRDWGIRRMRTKWGSCSMDAGRIWVNLELAKKDPRCLEYIIVHEMVHLLERHHNDRFVALMDKAMPDWRQRRDELNRAPLAHEDWKY